MGRFTYPFIAIAAVFGVLAVGCSHEKPVKNLPPKPTANVEVKEISMRTDASFFQAVGRVKNVRESTVASKVMGKVLDVRVKAGDSVKKGSVLIKIDDRDTRGRVEQAQGALRQAEAAKTISKQMLDRFEKLQKTDSASKAKYDKAVFDYQSAVGAVEQASGALKTAKSYLKESIVVAPFSGKIIDTMIEEGEMASPGFPLLRIEGESALEFEATVNGQDINMVEVGDDVTVVLDMTRSEQKEFSGKVSEIVPTSDRITHSNLVRIKLDDNDQIRSGMFGRARFARKQGSCPGILVDSDRLVRHGQLSAVFVVDQSDTVRLRLVREGRQIHDQVEILSGLAEGDRLVVSAIDGLIDGQPAKVVVQ